MGNLVLAEWFTLASPSTRPITLQAELVIKQEKLK
jgi:hypothetical protein